MTLQKKLDKLGDRLKNNHKSIKTTEIIEQLKTMKAEQVGDLLTRGKTLNEIKADRENPYDLHIKGLKYDTLKKRNDELVDVLNDLYKRIYPNALYNKDLWQRAEKLIKNNDND